MALHHNNYKNLFVCFKRISLWCSICQVPKKKKNPSHSNEISDSSLLLNNVIKQVLRAASTGLQRLLMADRAPADYPGTRPQHCRYNERGLGETLTCTYSPPPDYRWCCPTFLQPSSWTELYSGEFMPLCHFCPSLKSLKNFKLVCLDFAVSASSWQKKKSSWQRGKNTCIWIYVHIRKNPHFEIVLKKS